MSYRFPFGEELRKVEQKDKSLKEYFILGVYASAVHAKWIGIDGKTKVKALAVASEPEIFWKGDEAKGEEIISKIKIPKELGKLELAASMFNGPSGIALDEYYLKPLGLTRNDVWLCDLLPYSRLNNSQLKAIKREYEPLKSEFNLPQVTIPNVPSEFCDENRIKEIIAELKISKTKKIILLGDIPIKQFAKLFNPKYKKLASFKDYGKYHILEIDNELYQILPLVHPRQASRLGRSSYNWYNLHQEWVKEQTLKK